MVYYLLGLLLDLFSGLVLARSAYLGLLDLLRRGNACYTVVLSLKSSKFSGLAVLSLKFSQISARIPLDRSRWGPASGGQYF